MYAIIDLHDRILFYLIIIITVVTWFLFSSLTFNPSLPYQKANHGNLQELGWTISPAFILWAIGLPSQKLLYMMDEIIDPELTVKAIGNQWYWSYEYTDYNNEIAFDSFLVDEASLEPGQPRMLAVDNNQVLPVNTSIRLLVSATDVIHSFAVPSQGIKVDAIPGRLNSTGLIITRPGMFYGQCSELCGFQHGMMPIGVQAVTQSNYQSFISNYE